MRNVDLLIIGGGSAGIASAIAAYDAGIHDILILEKEAYLGGILLQCIHNGFGLHQFNEELTGPEYAFRYIDMVHERKIAYKLQSMVLEITADKVVAYSNESEGYQEVQAKAIICATGCSERTRGAIHIPGDRPSGIITAGLAQKYINIDGYMVGKRVFILGSGDIGLIMARRMRLEGAEVLGVAEIMPYSNGLTRNIVQCLVDYDIPLYLQHTVKKIIGDKRIEKIIICQVDGQFNFIENTDKEFEIDTLLLSVGLIPSNPLLEKINIAMHPRTKGPIVDENMQTSIPGIFACGNSLHVHDLVDFVSREGMHAGIAASQYIKGQLTHFNRVELTVGKGLIYVLPQYIHLDQLEKATIYYRVEKPMKNVFIQVLQSNKIIKKMKKQFLLPAEMESFQILKHDLNGTDTLVIEVSYD